MAGKMALEIFVDTSAWLALADSSDDLHENARRTYRTLLGDRNRLLTTNMVIAESYTLIHRRIGFSGAMRFLHSIRSSSRLERIYSVPALEEQAEAILERYADQRFSFADAVSFAVMNGRKVTQAFTFDHHFLVSGFLVIP